MRGSGLNSTYRSLGSAAAPGTFEDVVDWLTGCEYRPDAEFFHEADYWQHPCTFETLRVGDCEDFALWAWRRLGELGFDVEFVAGRTRSSDDGDTGDPWATGHAWVHFLDAGRPMLLDAVAYRNEPIIRPIESVRDSYVPEVSVDSALRRYVYGGYYLLRSGRGLP